jgi:hypothetical protein
VVPREEHRSVEQRSRRGLRRSYAHGNDWMIGMAFERLQADASRRLPGPPPVGWTASS